MAHAWNRRAALVAAGLFGAGLLTRHSGDAAAAATGAPRPPALLLASMDGPQIDPARYLVSEKFDGVRAWWDGSTLRFRSGRVVPAPAWFVRRLPNQALDGELWLGRGRFDGVSALVRSETPDDAAWRRVSYMAFELPGAAGTYAERAERLAALASDHGWSQLRAVAQQRVADRPALQRLLDDTVRAGGEGLMLHLASAHYVTGRSDVLIKLKPQQDAEAIVIGHRAGQGKYAGLMGALRVETSEGRRFLLGTGFTDAQRHDPPPIGATVTYRYRELTGSGLPRFASFLRVHDLP